MKRPVAVRGLSPRRRSILNRINNLPPEDLAPNDDEAERAAILEEERLRSSVSTFSTPSSTRSSLVSDITPVQREHFQGCLKLYAENKINKFNAWNLQLIDFMSTMLKKHDERMTNLQSASTTLDASARIYSFRVDAIHEDVLKMAGGLSKAVQSKRGKRQEDDEQEQNDGADENGADDDPTRPKRKEKRKKSAKGSLATNIQSQINTEIEVNECIDPFFAQLAATTGDMTSSHRAFNATLPVDSITLEIILSSDIKFMGEQDFLDEKLDLENLITFDCSAKSIPIVKNDQVICQSFNGFSINNWNPEEEEAQLLNKTSSNWINDDNLNLSQQAMVFDINADVEPLPQNDFVFDDHHDAVESDEEEEGIMSNAIRRDRGKVVLNLIEMRPSSNVDGYLEYSYSSIIVGAWAGPAHWKLKNNINRGLRVPERNNQVTAVVTRRAPARKKQPLNFASEGVGFNQTVQKRPELADVLTSKTLISQKTLSESAAWNQKNFKRPVDRGFTMTHFRKLYLQPTILMSLTSDEKALQDKAQRIDQIIDYNYDNDHDNSYCLNSQPHDNGNEWGHDEDGIEGDVHTQRSGLEMVEPPTKVAKIFIPYATRAKKVDMKQLKTVTWRMLTSDESDSNKESQVKEVNFMSLYNDLPQKLSTNMKEALSLPLALLAVLHLANEKGLTLSNNEQYTDFTIKPLDDSSK